MLLEYVAAGKGCLRKVNRDDFQSDTACVAWTLLLAVGLDAQSHRGAIRGRVEDASGAVVAGAAVTAVNEATNETRTTATGDAGAFALAELAPGTWRVEIAAPGHKTARAAVTLDVNQERRADAQLQLGALTDRVEVAAPIADIRRDSPAVGTVVENRQILDMPLDGRNFLELTLLAPGAVPAAQGSAGSVRGDFSFSVNGGREDFNSFLLDGADNVDPKLNTAGVRPPVDAIQEFEVLTSTPEAAHGRQAASQISVVMKSGTNQLQGTAYTFIRNGALDATNYFAPKRRARSGVSADAVGILDRRSDRPRSHVLLRRLRGHARRRRHHAHHAPCRPTPRAMRFRRSLTHPVGRAIAALYPEPEPVRRGRQLRGVADPARSHRSLRRAQRHRVRRRVRSDGALQLRRSAPVRAVQRSRIFVAARLRHRRRAPRAEFRRERDAHPVAESAERDARRRSIACRPACFPKQGGAVNRSVGLPEPWTNPRDAGLSLITVSGYSPLGHEYNNPQSGTTNTIHVADTLTWTRGNHLVKAGFDARLIRQDAFRDVQARGSLTFTGAFTGNPLVDLLVGPADVHDAGARSTTRSVCAPSRTRGSCRTAIRIRPNLTLSAGLRYDLTSPPVDVDDRATLYDPQTGALQPVGTGGLPRAGYDADRNNWAPRIGAAWTVDAAATTVLRGAYGIHYNHSALAPSEGLYFSAPYFNFAAYFTSPLGTGDVERSVPEQLPDSRRRIRRSAFSAICGRRFCTSST